MQPNQRVFYHNAEWIFIEQLGNVCRLKSINKNIAEIQAPINKIKPREKRA